MKCLSYKEAIMFHGHNGPFLTIGYSAGTYAMDILKPKRIKDIVCSVEIIRKTPYTCIIDGIQCSTYCTLGKGNINIKGLSRGVKLMFESDEKRIILIPKPQVLETALEQGCLDNYRQWMPEKPVESFFEIEEI